MSQPCNTGVQIVGSGPPIVPTPTLTLGVVSYLNALPLYQPLVSVPGVRIQPAVPARLASLLRNGECDCAMVPVIDFFRSPESLRLIGDGCIASDGETMTVRVFSRIPPDKVQHLQVDGHSHTSVVLAQVIWRELYGTDITIGIGDSGTTDPDSILLIGDKVINQAPRGYGFEVDLGAAWKHLTGLPFVFAAWYSRTDAELPGIEQLLARARDKGVAMAEQIAIDHAADHGWPKSIAVDYLCRTLKYKLTPPMREAMQRFGELARKYDLIKSPSIDATASTALLESQESNTKIRRVSTGDLRDLYLNASIHDVGERAHGITQRLHPEDYRTYVVDRNINYANWCTAKCIFCNFKADVPGVNTGRRDLPAGYTLTYAQIGKKIEELIDIGGTQILMQGGLVPGDGEAGLPFGWYLDLMRFIRREYPQIHIHAFSPPEIFAFHQIFDMSIHDVLARLMEAGLHSVPGGGGEILSDRVRKKIGVGKTLTDEWLEVMKQCHILGMRTSCTMMFGHIETIDERFEHLRLIRDLQDESLARNNGGGFGAYICWTFQPDNTPLGKMKSLPDGSAAIQNPNRRVALETSKIQNRPLNDGKHLLLADAHEYLTMLALSRIYLDNIPNIQSSWVTQGPKIGQLALYFGANDMGSVMMEENVVSAAGTTYHLNETEIRRLIEDAGWRAVKRDYHYRPLIGD